MSKPKGKRKQTAWAVVNTSFYIDPPFVCTDVSGTEATQLAVFTTKEQATDWAVRSEIFGIDWPHIKIRRVTISP